MKVVVDRVFCGPVWLKNARLVHDDWYNRKRVEGEVISGYAHTPGETIRVSREHVFLKHHFAGAGSVYEGRPQFPEDDLK